MFLEIITPDKKIFAGEVKLVKLPGGAGAYEVLENHAPIISTLIRGTIKYIENNDQENLVEVKGGIAEVKGNKIIVLAESL